LLIGVTYKSIPHVGVQHLMQFILQYTEHNNVLVELLYSKPFDVTCH